MSVWSYITEIELQSLRAAHQAVADAKAEMVRLDAAVQDATRQRHALDSQRRDYQNAVVARAVGQSTADLPPAPPSADELRLRMEALEIRQREQRGRIEHATHLFNTRRDAVLRACTGRAANVYAEHARSVGNAMARDQRGQERARRARVRLAADIHPRPYRHGGRTG